MLFRSVTALEPLGVFYPPSTIPPISKQGLWLPVLGTTARSSAPAKRVAYKPIEMKRGLWSPYRAKKAEWLTPDNGQGSVP